MLALSAAFIGTLIIYGESWVEIPQLMSSKIGPTFELIFEWNAPLVWFIPAFFGRLLMLLYFASGQLLKAGDRLDLSLAWFNRYFDVKKHPLLCIGFVAGILAALSYWLLADISLVP